MGKFIKTCLIVGVICVVAGVLTSGTGIFKGGLSQLKEEILNGEWVIGENAGIKPFFELEEQHYFHEDKELVVDQETVRDSISKEEVQELHVKSAGVTVVFVEYEGDDFLIEADMVHEYQIFLEKGELYIIARGQNTKELGSGKVRIDVPRSVYEEGRLEVEVEAAASKVAFDRVAAEEVELKVSAGTISWNDLTTRNLSVEMSAGTVTGSNTNVLEETDMKVSAGTLNLTGVLGNETKIDMSAGMVDVTLLDTYTDYNYDISCAGGAVKVGEQAAEGLAKSQQIHNGAAKNIEIECSMGAVNINFAE